MWKPLGSLGHKGLGRAGHRSTEGGGETVPTRGTGPVQEPKDEVENTEGIFRFLTSHTRLGVDEESTTPTGSTNTSDEGRDRKRGRTSDQTQGRLVGLQES